MLQHFNDISEEANDRCKKLRAVKKKLQTGLQSDALVIFHCDYLPTFICDKLKIYFYDRRRKQRNPVQITRI